MTEGINSIGILKESRTDESRAPITPKQISQIKERFPHINICIQPSDKRTFKDEEYKENGAVILEHLFTRSSCSFIFL